MKKNLAQIFAISTMTFASLVLSGCSSPTADNGPTEYVYPDKPDEPRFYFERMLMGSANVEFQTEEDQITQWLAGVGRVNQGMTKPYGVSTHEGRIFVSDPPSRDVYLFDPNQYLYKRLNSSTDVKLVKPFGLDNDSEGNLYVLDQSASDIKIFDRDGNILRTIDQTKNFIMPTGLAVTPDGSKIYVSNTGGVSSEQHNIVVIDSKTGDLLKTIGTRGKGELEFNLPKDIALGKNGQLYVVDSGNFRVQVIDPDTETLVLEFGQVGRSLGSFSRPKGIATDAQGNIYVSDAAFGNFQIFNSEGKLLMFIGKRGDKLEPATYMLNSDIDVDEDGRVLMADQFFRKVDIYRPVAVSTEQGYLGVKPRMSDEEYLKLKQQQDEAEAAVQ